MKLGKLKLKNFGPYKELEIDFSSLSVTGIVCNYKDNPLRSNGGGKTKILEAITYCIYGVGRDQFEEELIRENEEVMQAYLSFDKDGKLIEIERTKSESKTLLVLKINGMDKSESKPETEDKIIKLIGMDYDLFSATVFFEQDKNDNFTSANPSVRKEYLKKLLKLEIWDECYAKAKDKTDQVEAELNAAKSQLEYVSGKEEDDLDEIKREYSLLKIENERIEEDIKSLREKSKGQSEAKTKIDSMEEKIESAQDTLDSDKANYDENISTIKRLDEKITRIRKEINSRKETEGVDSLKKKLNRVWGEIEDTKSNRISCSTELNLLSKKAVRIEKSESCSECNRPISQTLREELLESNSKTIKKLTQEIEECDKRSSDLRKQEDELKAKIRDAESSDKSSESDIEKSQSKIDALKEVNSGLLSRIQKQEGDISTNRKTLNSLKKEYDSLYKDNDFDNELEELEEENRGNISKLSKLNERVKSLKERQGEIDELKAKVNKNMNRFNNWCILKAAFSKNGIISDIIKNSIDDLEENANQVLSEIDDGEFRISLETEGETKKGKARDTLEIWINNVKRNTRRKYRSYSGGQRAIFNFSIRMALSMLLSKRENVFHGIIFLDEIFGSLDEFNRNKMKKVINYLRGMFPQIFAISHTDLQEAFRNIIKVEYDKKTNTSKIVEVA